MEPYKKHESIAALMNRSNVDTDQIIPKQFLKKVERSGFGQHLFHDWRFNDDGSDNPEFELNKPAFKGATYSGGRRQLRLRLIARTRAVGDCRLWF